MCCAPGCNGKVKKKLPNVHFCLVVNIFIFLGEIEPCDSSSSECHDPLAYNSASFPTNMTNKYTIPCT